MLKSHRSQIIGFYCRIATVFRTVLIYRIAGINLLAATCRIIDVRLNTFLLWLLVITPGFLRYVVDTDGYWHSLLFQGTCRRLLPLAGVSGHLPALTAIRWRFRALAGAYCHSLAFQGTCWRLPALTVPLMSSGTLCGKSANHCR